MTDRELLELAAKAAGLDVAYVEVNVSNGPDGKFYRKHPDGKVSHHRASLWDPLTDDGDALKLVVALRLSVHVWDTDYLEAVSVAKSGKEGEAPGQNDWHFVEAHSCADDLGAATRLAIVRCAAEIGKVRP